MIIYFVMSHSFLNIGYFGSLYPWTSREKGQITKPGKLLNQDCELLKKINELETLTPLSFNVYVFLVFALSHFYTLFVLVTVVKYKHV